MRLSAVELVFGAMLALFILAGRQQIPIIAADLGPSELTSVRFVAGLVILCLTAILAALHLGRDGNWAATQKLSLVCLSWLLVRSVLEVHSEYAVDKLQDIALLTTVVFCVSVVIGKEFSKSVAEVTVLVVVCLSLLLALIASLSPNVGESGRVAALGGGPNVFGRIMGFLLLAGLHGMISGKRTVGVSMVGLGGIMLLLSGSRGAMFGAACGALAFLVMTRSSWSTRGLMKGMVAGLGAVGVAAVLSGKAGAALKVIAFRIVELTFRQGYTSNREPLVGEAVRQMRSAPVAGEGIGSYQWTGIDAYPHNIFLELGVEGGAIAIVLFLALTASMLREMRKVRSPSFASFVASSWVAIVAASLFSGDLFDARAAFLLPALLPVLTHVSPTLHETRTVTNSHTHTTFA